MAALSKPPPINVVPVIFLSEQSDVLNTIFINTKSNIGPSKSGEVFVKEIKRHRPSTKLSRFAKHCALKQQIVSVTNLIAVSTTCAEIANLHADSSLRQVVVRDLQSLPKTPG